MTIKSYQKDFFYLAFVTLIFFVPIFFVGADRLEDTKYNHFSLLFQFQNLFNPFVFYYDLIGPGTRMPLGVGLDYFYPPAIFINNLKIFYLSSFILGFYLQLNFLKKLLKLFEFKNVYILSFFYSLGISNIFYLIAGDSIKTFFLISCFPVIFYYFLKFLRKKSQNYFFKLILFSSYLIVNSHPVSILLSFLSFVLLVVFNQKYFFLKKKYFYIGLLLFLLVISEELYRLIYEATKFNESERALVLNLDLKHYTSGIVFILKFFEGLLNFDFPFLSKFKDFDNFYLPFGGILFYFSFYEAVRLIIKKDSKKIFFINYVFILIIFLSVIDLSPITFGVISTPFVIRDINNFFSIFLFGSFLLNIKNLKISNIVLFLCIITTLVHLGISVERHIKDHKDSSYNILKPNSHYYESNFSMSLKEIDNNEKYAKTYLSEDAWKLIHDRRSKVFLEANIFYFTDLIKYKIYPFNLQFKNASKHQLRLQPVKMYTILEPKKEEINNNFFFNIFNINYLLILESEIEQIDLNKFKKIASIKNLDDNFLFLELLDKRSVLLNPDYVFKDNKCELKPEINCLINQKDLFIKSDKINFNRINLNKYKIKNISNEKTRFVVPFLYDESWRSSDGEIENIKDTLMFVEIEPNSEIVIFYRDHIRIVLKIFSIISFLFLIFFLIKIKKTY